MNRPVVDLTLRRALRRDAETIAAEHPELTDDAARERCGAWLAGEEPDDTVEPASSAGRRQARPASRDD